MMLVTWEMSIFLVTLVQEADENYQQTCYLMDPRIIKMK